MWSYDVTIIKAIEVTALAGCYIYIEYYVYIDSEILSFLTLKTFHEGWKRVDG